MTAPARCDNPPKNFAGNVTPDALVDTGAARVTDPPAMLRPVAAERAWKAHGGKCLACAGTGRRTRLVDTCQAYGGGKCTEPPAPGDSVVALCPLHREVLRLEIGREHAERRRLEPGQLMSRRPHAHPPLVYFGRRGDLIKIGTSTNVTDRAQALDLDEILVTVPGGRREEKQVHAAFAHLRHRGEWYRQAPELTAFLDDLRRNPPTAADHKPGDLVDTATAAHAVGIAASGFTTWARRRGLRPVRHERAGRKRALWELQAVYQATQLQRRRRVS